MTRDAGLFVVERAAPNKLKRAILKLLADDYLWSIAEIFEALDLDRVSTKGVVVNREAVKAALWELRQENKVSTIRRRWSII